MNSFNKRILLTLVAIVAFFYSSAIIFMSLSPIIVVEIFSNDKYSGLPGAIFLIAGAISTPLAVHGIRKYGTIAILKIAFLIGILGSFFAYIGHIQSNFIYFLMGLALMGVTGAVVMLSRTLATEVFPIEKQANAMSIIMFGAVVGGLLSPLFYKITSQGMISIEYSWLYVAFFFSFGFFILTKKVSSNVNESKKLLRNVDFNNTHTFNKKLVSMIVLLGALSHATMLSIMSISGHVMNHGNIEVSAIYYAMGIHFIGMFGSMPVSGFLYKRLRFKRSIYLSIILYILSIYFYNKAYREVHYFFALWLLGTAWSVCFLSVSMKLSEISALKNKIKIIAQHDILASILGVIFTLVIGVIYINFSQIELLYILLIPISLMGILIITYVTYFKGN